LAVLCFCRRFDHTSLSPFWLYSPYSVAVWDCRRFGVAVLTFDVLVCRRFNQAPTSMSANYWWSQLQSYPRINLATYGGRAFTYAGPTTWNSLPDRIKDTNILLPTFIRHISRPSSFSTSTLQARLRCFTKTRYISSLLLCLCYAAPPKHSFG